MRPGGPARRWTRGSQHPNGSEALGIRQEGNRHEFRSIRWTGPRRSTFNLRNKYRYSLTGKTQLLINALQQVDHLFPLLVPFFSSPTARVAIVCTSSRGTPSAFNVTFNPRSSTSLCTALPNCSPSSRDFARSSGAVPMGGPSGRGEGLYGEGM